MIRNFVAGALWGGVVAGVGLGVMSQVTPMPGVGAQLVAAASAPVAVQVAEAAAQETVIAPEAAAPAVVEAKPKPLAPPQAPAEAAPDLPQGEPAVVEASPKPLAPPQAPAEVAPDLPQGEPAVVEASPKPLAPPQAPADAAPDLPQVDPAVTPIPNPAGPVAADSAAPAKGAAVSPAALPPTAPAEAPAAPLLLDPVDQSPAVVVSPDPAPAPQAPGGLPAIASGETVPANAELPPPATVQPDESLLDAAPQPVAEPAPAAIVPEPVPTPTPAPTPAVEPPKPGLLADDAPDTLAPAPALPDAVDGVTSGRLPRIGDVAPAPAPEVALAMPEDAPPIVRFARPFQNDSGKPLFAIVLRDTGGAEVDRAKLAALPFPITFVVDPLTDTAAEAATIYRAAGQEVVMLASGIPEGALASDLEQTFQAHAGTLPDAVAVMDPGVGGFQDNRPLATQVVPLIKAQGRGLITFERGLNAADQVARRDDVASATIFRQLDGEGEDIPVIRRYLDRAAFKAAQEGRVMVLGDTRPETIAALMEWTVEGRASSVTLAPATAVMAVQ